MRYIIILMLLAGLYGFRAGSLSPRKSQPVGAAKKPNVILIMADDLGFGELGCYGQQLIKTPNLDRMAREGLRFTQFYAGAPVCAPSRCTLLTGQHTGHAYIRGNYELGGFADSLEGGQMPLPPGTFTLGHLMQSAGYTTACIGKWGLGMHTGTGNPNQQGFDFFYGYLDQKQAHNYYPTHLWKNGQPDPLGNPPMDVHRKGSFGTEAENYAYFQGKTYAPDRLHEQARQFLQGQSGQKPFFLLLTPTIPHASLQAPPEAVAAYANQFGDKPYRGEQGYAWTRHPRATYAAMISYLDRQVGEILELLRQRKLDDNTLVLFTSDNGTTFNGAVDARFFNSVAGLKGLKMDVYEGGIRVPLLAWWPGRIAAGQTTDIPSVNYDFFPTLAELTDRPTQRTDGLSLLPTLFGQPAKQQKHPFLYFEYPEKGGQVAVRMGNWKGVRRGLLTNQAAPWELYNLSSDPFEQENVAASHPDVLRQLDDLVKREHRPAHIREWEIIQPKFDRKAGS